MSRSKSVAFMSYAHVDNKNGQLTEFRERLRTEVQIQTGDEFPIFLDRDDVALGQDWSQRIREVFQEEVTFLIPIITPGFFKSEACRSELEMFLDREKSLGRRDLVLPVYYVHCPVLDDDTRRSADRLAQVIASRQWADWRGLRFESFDSVEVNKAVAQIADQIRAAQERLHVLTSSPDREADEKRESRAADVFLSYAADDEAVAKRRREDLGPWQKLFPILGWTQRVVPLRQGRGFFDVE